MSIEGWSVVASFGDPTAAQALSELLKSESMPCLVISNGAVPGLWPLVWLLSLPFRLIGITFEAVFALLRAILFLPAITADAAEAIEVVRSSSREPCVVSGACQATPPMSRVVLRRRR